MIPIKIYQIEIKVSKKQTLYLIDLLFSVYVDRRDNPNPQQGALADKFFRFGDLYSGKIVAVLNGLHLCEFYNLYPFQNRPQ